MGDVEPTEFNQRTIKGKDDKDHNIVNIVYKMKRSVEDGLYGYLGE